MMGEKIESPLRLLVGSTSSVSMVACSKWKVKLNVKTAEVRKS